LFNLQRDSYCFHKLAEDGQILLSLIEILSLVAIKMLKRSRMNATKLVKEDNQSQKRAKAIPNYPLLQI
jgi:hypothetical protein